MEFLKKTLLYLFFGTHKISPSWYLKTKIRLLFSSKKKIGFGPITSGEEDLSVRKWRIDPIIDAINQGDGPYVAGFFLHPKEMRTFDCIVLVKRLDFEWMKYAQLLNNKILIYDIVDNPNDEVRYRFYFRTFPLFFQRVDAFILSSPVHTHWMQRDQKRFALIEHPILNPCYKRVYEERGEISILAQGYYENLQNLRWIDPLLPKLSFKLGKPIRLYYHSEVQEPDTEWVKHIPWSVASCFEVMLSMDFAITMKDLFRLHQYTKPSTKVIAYMAAGLAVICKPTAADREVINHCINGVFAYRKEDWLYWIERLSSSRALRRQLGRAARKSVADRYCLDVIAKKYYSLFDSLLFEKHVSFSTHT